jgi:hypothetical protein
MGASAASSLVDRLEKSDASLAILVPLREEAPETIEVPSPFRVTSGRCLAGETDVRGTAVPSGRFPGDLLLPLRTGLDLKIFFFRKIPVPADSTEEMDRSAECDFLDGIFGFLPHDNDLPRPLSASMMASHVGAGASSCCISVFCIVDSS